ncbi:MAG: type I phosphomannose isomerase catalytic subunit [Ethanoligenens sp.]
MAEKYVCYPMKMLPAFKDYIWGGDILSTRYHKPSPYVKTAESWELSCHPAGESVISNGTYAGKTLRYYIDTLGKQVLGTHCAQFVDFPVLIKLIDANSNLSIQVHPDDTYALQQEHAYGKTEMWYIVDCIPGASIVYGFKKDICQKEFRRRIAENTLLDVLNVVPVNKGDAFMIRSGTIHAIGKGCLIAEIQQNSDVTYRVYDYGRLGKDGKPRQLHVEKALQVINLHPVQPQPELQTIQLDGFTRKTLAACAYFTVELLDVKKAAALESTEESFHALTCTDGSVTLQNGTHPPLEIIAGDTVFLPANSGAYTLKGIGNLLLTHL